MTKPSLILLLLLLLPLSGCKSRKPVAELRPRPHAEAMEGWGGMEYAPSTLIIMVDAEVGKEPLRKAVEKYGATIIYDYSIIPGMAKAGYEMSIGEPPPPTTVTLNNYEETKHTLMGHVGLEYSM